MTFEAVIKNFTTAGLRLEDVRCHLDSGGNIHQRDQHMNWSLLHFAAEDCNSEIIRLLVSHGTDLASTDRNGWTPLHIAVDSDLDTSGRDGRSATKMPTVQTLIALGADESLHASDGATARDIAVVYGQEALYDSLVRP